MKYSTTYFFFEKTQLLCVIDEESCISNNLTEIHYKIIVRYFQAPFTSPRLQHKTIQRLYYTEKKLKYSQLDDHSSFAIIRKFDLTQPYIVFELVSAYKIQKFQYKYKIPLVTGTFRLNTIGRIDKERLVLFREFY